MLKSICSTIFTRLDQIKISCGYLESNAQRMRYNEYPSVGYPIGSGIIEGACRHIIVGRLEESGMRWVMAGEKVMLGLRCIYINGDFIETEVEWFPNWNEFTAFEGKTIEEVSQIKAKLKFTKDLSSLEGKEIKMVFRLRGSKLYSMQFVKK